MALDRRVAGAVILANGAVPTRALLDASWPGWADGIGLVVAADGGARHATALGLHIDRWVGDGDSIEPALLGLLESGGVQIQHAPAAKDETDTELALLAAIEAGAGEIQIIGSLGGARMDHALANVSLLAHPALAGRPAWLYDERAARISLLVAPGAAGGHVVREFRGRPGDLVSLLPVSGSVAGVTTGGLRFPLANEPLIVGRTRGVSNVRTEAVARISLESGRLLVIETPVSLHQ